MSKKKGDYEDYKASESRYQTLKRQHTDLMVSLDDAIDDYASERTKVNSKKAGREILQKWDRKTEFVSLTVKEGAASVFGISLRENLVGKRWTKDSEKVAGEDVTVYHAPNEEEP